MMFKLQQLFRVFIFDTMISYDVKITTTTTKAMEFTFDLESKVKVKNT